MNSENGDSIYFKISRSKLNKELYQNLIICADMRNMSDFTYVNFGSTTAGNYNNTILTAPSLLYTDRFPPGILHLTVFDPNCKVLAERLIFLQARQKITDVELKAVTLDMTSRAKNTFQLSIPNEFEGSYSVSVTDPDLEPETRQRGNIVSNLLLTSDLKNYVRDPGWYIHRN